MAAYSDAHAEIAQEVLGEAIEELLGQGFDPVEVGHALVHTGLDWLPGACCPCCLAGEYGAIVEAVQDRLGEIEKEPGVGVEPVAVQH